MSCRKFVKLETLLSYKKFVNAAKLKFLYNIGNCTTYIAKN